MNAPTRIVSDAEWAEALGEDPAPFDLKPYSLPLPDRAAIPQELVNSKIWIAYKIVRQPGRAKPDKLPISPVTGSGTGWPQPSAWTDFDTARAYAQAKGLAGVGVVLTPGGDLIGGDLDHCRDPATGVITPEAQRIIERADTYTELSPGLNGLRFFALGSFGGHTGNDHARGIEFYEDGRFLTVTGLHLPGTPYAVNNRDLTALGQEFFTPKAAAPASESAQIDFAPVDLTRWALSDHTRHTITTGDVTPYGGDRSTAIFCMAKDLIRAGMTEAETCCALCDPEHPISEVAFERRGGDLASAMDWVMKYAVVPARRELKVELEGEFGTIGASAAWGQMEPLPVALSPVMPFDDKLLPNALRPWIADIAERMQCPPDYPAVALMVALASVVGRQVAIRPKAQDDWTVTPNLWGAIVGRPALLKTPAMLEPLRLIQGLESQAREEFERRDREHAAEKMLREADAQVGKTKITQAVKDGNRELAMGIALEATEVVTPPTRRRYVTQDTTVEKLGELMRDNPRGVLVYRDELVGFLKTLDKEGHEGARAFFLEAWNGTGSFTFDRIGRGTVEIEAACVSIIGAIQPGLFQAYMAGALAGGAGDDGLVQRFQMAVWPDTGREWVNVDRWPDTQARQEAKAIFQRLDHLDSAAMGAQQAEWDPVPWLRFSPEAQDKFNNWRADLERRIRDPELHPALESHLAKYRSLVPSLALLAHLVDEPETGSVGKVSLLRALDWSEYLETHARRLYGPALAPEMYAACELAKHLHQLPGSFTAKEVYRKHWRGLDTEGTSRALQVLIDYGHLRAVAPEERQAGRPTTRYAVHPDLRRAAP